MTIITIPRAVVEQALEALELGYDAAKSEADQYHAAMAGFRPERHAQMDGEVQQIAAAITALRAALAQQGEAVAAERERCAEYLMQQAAECRENSPTRVTLESCAAVLRLGLHAQAEPVEPVAWVRLEAWKSGKYWPDDCFTALPAEGLTPVYTPPPQRKPLTEGALMGVYIDFDRAADPAWSKAEYLLRLFRAIERAHGIPMPEAPACPDCHGVGYDASGQLCACQENPSF